MGPRRGDTRAWRDADPPAGVNGGALLWSAALRQLGVVEPFARAEGSAALFPFPGGNLDHMMLVGRQTVHDRQFSADPDAVLRVRWAA